MRRSKLIVVMFLLIFVSHARGSVGDKLLSDNIIDLETRSYLLKKEPAKMKVYSSFENTFIRYGLNFNADLDQIVEDANANDIRSMYYLALYYIDKERVCDKGLYWLNRALDRKLVLAAVKFGSLIEKGECGFSASTIEAIPYYEVGLNALEPESIFRLYGLAMKKKYRNKVSKSELLLHSAFMGLPTAQLILAREILLDNTLNANKSLVWYVLAYIDGMKLPLNQNVYQEIMMVSNKYGGVIDAEGHSLLDRLGKFKYYKFAYTDLYEGEEFFD